MPGHDAKDAGEIRSHFEYFVLRIVQGGTGGLSGTAERLGSQRKVEFHNTAELLHLLENVLEGQESFQRPDRREEKTSRQT